jgi:hypothetical protein
MTIPLKEKVKTIFRLISEPRVLSSLISLRTWGYLVDMGWFNSFKSSKPVNAAGSPIPWFTYPAIEILSDRLNQKMSVFEFGSGNSTLFFAGRVRQVVSAEHNKDWYDKISKQAPVNSRIVYVKADQSNEYTDILKRSNQKFDIIIVDGIYRNECLIESISYITDGGVIILDDSERLEYTMGVERIIKQNFKRLDFWGISPGYLYRKSTTIFYRPDNCVDF